MEITGLYFLCTRLMKSVPDPQKCCFGNIWQLIRNDVVQLFLETYLLPNNPT